ncbi:ABC transporter ATP-binding protein [bacterium]|nr:ABC transporter ATP-binding protein [bacterium]
MNNKAIYIENLCKSFGTVHAVKGLNLDVPGGCVFGFLGPNGAGKTTAIRLLLGLLKPDAGMLCLFGQPVKHSTPAIMRRVGALVETASSYPHLSGYQNLDILRRMRDLSTSSIDDVLEIVRLKDVANRKVKTYSLGMRQRLGLAGALLGRPELLILDEPTNGLDPAGIREMRSLIRKLPDEWGVTIFLSSHYLSEIEQTATHLGIINEGALIFQGTPGDLHDKLTGQCVIGVDRPDEVFALLTAWGINVEYSEGRHLILPGTAESDLAILNARLVQEGKAVFHLAYVQPTLEDHYLAMTEEDV